MTYNQNFQRQFVSVELTVLRVLLKLIASASISEYLVALNSTDSQHLANCLSSELPLCLFSNMMETGGIQTHIHFL